MNKLVTLLLLFSVSVSLAQDSTTVKNSARISDLKERIERMQTATSPNLTECATEIDRLLAESRTRQDSIRMLQGEVRAMKEKGAGLNISAYLKDKMRSSDCGCTRIFYKTDEASSNYAGIAALDSIVSLAKSGSRYIVLLVGHADKSGSEVANILLSQKRVASLKDYLVRTKGLNSEFIDTEWHGSMRSVNGVVDAAKSDIDRRVEVFLIRP